MIFREKIIAKGTKSGLRTDLDQQIENDMRKSR